MPPPLDWLRELRSDPVDAPPVAAPLNMVISLAAFISEFSLSKALILS